MSVTWVSERLRLLALPEGAQDLIAAGIVPVEAERALRNAVDVSSRVAECVCVTAKRHDVPPSDFVRVFDQLPRRHDVPAQSGAALWAQHVGRRLPLHPSGVRCLSRRPDMAS